MIKRPLHPRFTEAVLSRRKVTTIREKPWPIGIPIMLYNWAGKAYRSKQIDVAEIRVESTCQVGITRTHEDLIHLWRVDQEDEEGDSPPLWQTEGFDSLEDLHAWFRPLLKPGHGMYHHLMTFHLADQPPSP